MSVLWRQMIAIQMLTVSTSLVPSSVYAVLAMMEMDLTVEVSVSEQLAFVTHYLYFTCTPPINIMIVFSLLYAQISMSVLKVLTPVIH